MENTRDSSFEIPVLHQLTQNAYDVLCARIFDDSYEPTPEELRDDYQIDHKIFFIVRRQSANYLVYID